MTTLTVWKFASPRGADEAVYTLNELEKQELIRVHDAAVVSWDHGAKKPRTRQLSSGPGALSGTFWGLLFGLLFMMPFVGAAVGATVGAVSKKLSDAGIDDEFLDKVRSEVTPGTSALFLVTSDAVIDKVLAAFAHQDMQLVTTNLSEEQQKALREAFSA